MTTIVVDGLTYVATDAQCRLLASKKGCIDAPQVVMGCQRCAIAEELDRREVCLTMLPCSCCRRYHGKGNSPGYPSGPGHCRLITYEAFLDLLESAAAA